MNEQQQSIFRRNNYFKGKLLTADDFRLEQNYYIDKRRFINGLVYCGGVISGLRVKKNSVNKVTVSAGAAIDYQGREIVVEKKQTITLTPEETNKTQGHAYLCLEYDEQLEEEALDSWKADEGERSFNKTRETYRLFWDYSDIDELDLRDRITGDIIFWDRKTVYKDESLLISQSVPKYAQPQRFFEIKIDVLRASEAAEKIEFSYAMKSEHVKMDDGKKDIEIGFNSALHMDVTEYNLSVYAISNSGMAVMETLSIDPKSFKIKRNGEMLTHKANEVSWEIERSETDVKRRVRDDYLDKDVEDMFGELNAYKLCLAKINYTVSTKTCKIESIENVPFCQYLESWRLNAIVQGVFPSQAAQREMITEAALVEYLSKFNNEIAQLEAKIKTLNEKIFNQFEVNILDKITKLKKDIAVLLIILEGKIKGEAKKLEKTNKEAAETLLRISLPVSTAVADTNKTFNYSGSSEDFKKSAEKETARMERVIENTRELVNLQIQASKQLSTPIKSSITDETAKLEEEGKKLFLAFKAEFEKEIKRQDEWASEAR